MKIALLTFFVAIVFVGYCAEGATETAKKECSLKFHEAFILQSVGKSTQAFFSFQSAFQQGMQAGESSQKLQAIADLFYWYRKYGTHLNLFARDLKGNEVISDEYRGHYCKENNKKHLTQRNRQFISNNQISAAPATAYPLAVVPNYSEWGKNPRQAAQIRSFMFGIGEIISAVLIFSVASPAIGWTALPTIGYDGVTRIFSSLNELWADHEIEMSELKKLTDQAIKVGQF